MRVALEVTGSDATSVRRAVSDQLTALNPDAEWTIKLNVRAVLRSEGGRNVVDWIGTVDAHDEEGEDEPAPLRVMGEGR